MSDQAQSPERGWVLYDGECAFCTRWITRVRNILARRGFIAETLQAPWVNERLKLPPSELLRDIRLLLREGRLLSGADAYLYVMRRIWFVAPLGVLFALPGLKQIFAAVYRRVATNRYCIAGTCRIPHK